MFREMRISCVKKATPTHGHDSHLDNNMSRAFLGAPLPPRPGEDGARGSREVEEEEEEEVVVEEVEEGVVVSTRGGSSGYQTASTIHTGSHLQTQGERSDSNFRPCAELEALF